MKPKINKFSFFLLLTIIAVSVFLHFFKLETTPPCFNADEAAYGYNAYSVLKTGKDEFGNPSPLLRLKSFGDYKLPLYTYLSVPFVKFLGLTEFAIRLPNMIFAILLPWSMYFLAKALFEKERTALLAATLTAVSPWINILSRHAHEVVTATFFLTTSFACLVSFVKGRHRTIFGLLFALFLSLSLYTYHISRLFFLFFSLIFVYYSYRRRIVFRKVFLIFTFLAIFALPFLYAEITHPPTRISHLLIINNPGIALKTQELKTEQFYSPFSQKIFITIDEIFRRYVTYFSPEFLVYKGDTNSRFGFETMHPLTPIEYFLFFVGLFFLFKKIPKQAGMLLSLLLLSPLPAALTWQEYALTRAYFMIIPILLFVSFGTEKFLAQKIPFKKTVVGIVIFLFLVYNVRSWAFFFLHYPRRATVVRAWQCGYKQLAGFIKENYRKYDKFYITKDVGQPYIFLLFYLSYPPEKFQKVVKTTAPDEYGYTQVLGFDKFIFSTDYFDKNVSNPKNLFILSQTEGQNLGISEDLVDKIKVETEEMFWICSRCSKLSLKSAQQQVKPQ